MRDGYFQIFILFSYHFIKRLKGLIKEMVRLFTKSKIIIQINSSESCVKVATMALEKDLLTVFGKEVVSGSYPDADIVILSAEEAKVCFEKLFYEMGEPHFEGYLLAEQDQTLFIIGSDMRGTMYGIYDVCNQIGISPWHFFADVPAKKKEYWEVSRGYRRLQYPSVKYRGIFINDEEELENWSKVHTADNTIGPETYRHIFDLLLRLRANYIWPAMHVNYFNGNAENGRLANEMGMIVGTSHCDMMMRSNHNEWKPWLSSGGYSDQEISYDYSIEGFNRDVIREYWSQGVKMNQDYNVTYTVGMRGIHDSGFSTKIIDENANLSEKERFFAKSKLLQQTINDQREILSRCLMKPAEEIPQIFVPYKEVLEYYDHGLVIPEDITIIWTNDNYGYIRRYPDQEGLKRKGGHGLYYHSSYWEQTNMHYLFISSTPLARMKNELHKAWDNGIRKLWVLNIGAIKPLEQDLEFYTRYAWEVGKEETTEDIEEFLADWINSEFTKQIGAKVGKLLNQFTQLVNVRKIELLERDVFSQTAFGDEGARRLAKLKNIFDEVNVIAECLPLTERGAYFQLVQMKIHAAYYKNVEIYFADRSILMYQQGKMNAADEYCRLSAEYMKYMRWMLYYYNKLMENGKWDEILTPEIAPPPNMNMYPLTKPALKIGSAELAVTLWCGAKECKELVFSQYSGAVKWLEIANLGKGFLSFELTCDDWIKLSMRKGEVETEIRIAVAVEDMESHFGERGKIVVQDSVETITEIAVFIQAPPNIQKFGDQTYLEADGYIAMAAVDYDEALNNSGESYWRIVPYLGRYEGAGLEAYSPQQKDLGGDELGENPVVKYSFYMETSGSHLLELYRLPTLNSVGRIRLGIQVDNEPIQIIESEVTDEHRGKWREAVKNEVDKLLLNLPYLTRGHHTLKLYFIDSYVLISKLVIYTGGYALTSLGPEKSIKVSEVGKQWNTFTPIPMDKSIYIKGEIWYGCSMSDVPLPSILYADQDYYSSDEWVRGNRKCQIECGEASYEKSPDGSKDIITDYLLHQKIQETDGKIAIEAELVLAQNENAYHNPALPRAHKGEWEHLGTATLNGSGIGMFIDEESGVLWENPKEAPSLNYVIDVSIPGDYYLWFYVKYDDRGEDEIRCGVNGEIIPIEQQYTPGGFFSYRYLNIHIWHWNLFAKIKLEKGKNTLSVFGRTALVKIDRIYLSLTDELPPLDSQWKTLNSTK